MNENGKSKFQRNFDFHSDNDLEYRNRDIVTFRRDRPEYSKVGVSVSREQHIIKERKMVNTYEDLRIEMAKIWQI